MEQLYRMMLTAGYPIEGIDWMRRHRASVIIVLALASWAVFIGLGWLVWTLLS